MEIKQSKFAEYPDDLRAYLEGDLNILKLLLRMEKNFMIAFKKLLMGLKMEY